MRSNTSLGKALKAAAKMAWWLVLAIVLLPVLFVTWGLRLAGGKAVVHELPRDVVSPRMMDRLKPRIAKGEQAAWNLWWRSALYHRLVQEYGASPEAAAEAAREATDRTTFTVKRIERRAHNG